MKVLVNTAGRHRDRVEAPLLLLAETVTLAVLNSENMPDSSEVSVVLADDELLQELNRRYRDIDAPTDVLSFPQYEEPRQVNWAEEPPVLGDVVVSVERALAQAQEYGHSFERELAFLVAHGVLHLLGYDHQTDEGEARMMGRTEEILTKLELGSC